MRIRLGLIGLGEVWQARHAPALRALADRFEVRAVCDPVRHRAEQAAAEFHAEAADGYHVLIQREDIDAVLVLSPQWFRALPILAACESRKAIYCAVGLDLDADEALSIKNRVEEAGIAFMAEFPREGGPGHHSPQGADRHAAWRAPAALLPSTLRARHVALLGVRRWRASAHVSTRDRAGGLVSLRC